MSTLNVRNDFKGTLTSQVQQPFGLHDLSTSQNRAGLGDVQGRQSLDSDPSFHAIGSYLFILLTSGFKKKIWKAKGQCIV